MVKPKKVGPVNIKVTARSSRAGDGVERILQVEPEGVTQYENLAMIVDLRDRTQFDGNFTFEIPKNAVSDSTRIEISAVGTCLLLFNTITYGKCEHHRNPSKRFLFLSRSP